MVVTIRALGLPSVSETLRLLWEGIALNAWCVTVFGIIWNSWPAWILWYLAAKILVNPATKPCGTP